MAMVILGIETTCDETSAGVVIDGRKVLSNVVSSSAEFYQKYKGVVPEIAAREHVRVIVSVIDDALFKAGISLGELDAVAVSHGPGLVGSLLIGTETAKVLALVMRKPLIPVNHLIGHVYANWLTVHSSLFAENHNQLLPEIRQPEFPLVALIVSGGHTDLILMKHHSKFTWLGGTRDDAAGEVFDKVARVLGLGYPGGPEIEEKASSWLMVNGKLKIKFPRPMMREDNFDFSFSGLKTAVVNFTNGQVLTAESKAEIANEFQNAIVEVLVKKTVMAAKKHNAKSIVVGGGVAANEYLRSQFSVYCSQLGLPVFFPSKDLSVDNGAMIAAAAFWLPKTIVPLKLQADPGLHF